jgi:hypothetical protein
MLTPILVEPLILGTVSPLFLPIPVLEVVLPMPLVFGSIGVRVHPKSIGLVVLPLSLEDVSIQMEESALTMCLVVSPLAFIPSPIWPPLYTKPITLTPQPLPLVHSSCLELEGTPLLPRLTILMCDILLLLDGLLLKVLVTGFIRFPRGLTYIAYSIHK